VRGDASASPAISHDTQRRLLDRELSRVPLGSAPTRIGARGERHGAGSLARKAWSAMYLCPYCGEGINQSTEGVPHCRSGPHAAARRRSSKAAATAAFDPDSLGIIHRRDCRVFVGLSVVHPAGGSMETWQRARSKTAVPLAQPILRAALASYGGRAARRRVPVRSNRSATVPAKRRSLRWSVGLSTEFTRPAPPSSDGVVRGYALQGARRQFRLSAVFILIPDGNLALHKRESPCDFDRSSSLARRLAFGAKRRRRESSVEIRTPRRT